ncbi:MAG: glycoside hydrolase family protein [Bacteroides sp.]|nr:glycoside hydrolase family protein [Roseburia sp.]MCM1346493.1 glycoside hydrolase family protein [Bacteroides sp.]MCM1420428.1 glycoside hydrolase family protein [Bacteroides sp.]
MNTHLQALIFLFLLLCTGNIQAKDIQSGKEYYIVSDYYNKVLGESEDGTTPRLSEIGKAGSADSYVFVAEESGTSGYVMLRQKSSGRYLVAGDNGYSLLFKEKGSGDAYLWSASVGFAGKVVSKKKTGNCLGVDWTTDDFAGAYYDKSFNTNRAWFTVFEALSSGYETSISAAQSDTYTNAYGVKERDIYCALADFSLAEEIDLHIISQTVPVADGVTIDIQNERAWIIFEHIRPSEVISQYLSHVTVNGTAAVNDKNVRVAIWLDGAVVIPVPAEKPFTGYTEKNYGGTEIALETGNNKDLSAHNNLLQGFKLRRGYMAVLATGKDGSGYSRVYVADHKDIDISELPEALSRRVSSIHIKKWQYVSKKGWGSTSGDSKIKEDTQRLRTTWYYTWSADRKSTSDMEYIPIQQHRYWPSMSQIAGHEAATAVLGINEPDHSEQHENCSCGGVTSAWTACTITPNLQSTGMRIGSPAATDASWLKEYAGHVDDMGYRCDFIATHCYWEGKGSNDAQQWYNNLKSIYDNTHRPIWITEWEIGASWISGSAPSSTEENRKAVLAIQEMLESAPFIERYAFYNYDSGWTRWLISHDDNWFTPAGQAYSKCFSNFAYNADYVPVPNWWKPGVKTVTLSIDVDSHTGKAVFSVSNPNTDVTETLRIQCKHEGVWTDFHTDTDRTKFDSSELTYTFDINTADYNADRFRVCVTTLYGGTTESAAVSSGLIANPDIETDSKDNVPGWTCQRSAANGYTKDVGDTYLEVWNSTAETINFDYYQELSDLANGVYELSAVCFNSTNGVEGAQVNGHVGLYAVSGGMEYFSPVVTDSEIDYSRKNVIERIVVRDGQMRIGLRNIGTMSARWAGADDFSLRYLGKEEDMLTEGYAAFAEKVMAETDERYRALFVETTDWQTDASQLIINTDCDRKDTYGWTTENVEVAEGEPWNDTTTNPYWNKWSGTAFTSRMEQTIEYVPRGEYSLSALLRGSSTAVLTLSATVTQADGTEQTYSQKANCTGNQSEADSEYPNGWHNTSVENIKVEQGGKMRITILAECDKSNWWSADHLTLYYQPLPVVDAIGKNVTEGAADFSLSAEKGVLRITTLRNTRIVIANICGTVVVEETVGQGTTTVRLPKGIYIVNGRKIAVI